MSKVHLTVQKYGNMSAATVPVAMVEALEGASAAARKTAHACVRCATKTSTRSQRGWSAHTMPRWANARPPKLMSSDVELAPLTRDKSALEMVLGNARDKDIRSVAARRVSLVHTSSTKTARSAVGADAGLSTGGSGCCQVRPGCGGLPPPLCAVAVIR